MSEKSNRASVKPKSNYFFGNIEEIDNSQDYSKDMIVNDRCKTDLDYEKERLDIIRVSNELRKKRSTSKN
jgi:hypothetical protein